MTTKCLPVSEANAMAAMYTANHLNGVAAIIALTESGQTAAAYVAGGIQACRSLRSLGTLGRLLVPLFTGAFTRSYFDSTKAQNTDVLRHAIKLVQDMGMIKSGDYDDHYPRRYYGTVGAE